MSGKELCVAALVALAATGIRAQQHRDPTIHGTDHEPAAATGFVASTGRTFDESMDDAISAMHRGMHDAPRSGDPNRDFVTAMIPHHQGAIDMAEVLLLYGDDEQLRRLAQELITDQQSEVELMQHWLAKHPEPRTGGATSSEVHR